MENLQVFSALEDNTISNPFLWRVTVHSVEDCILLILLKRNFPTGHDSSENHHRCLRSEWPLQTEERHMGAVQQGDSPAPSHPALVQSLHKLLLENLGTPGA